MVGRISTYAETNYILSIDSTVQSQQAADTIEESSGVDAQTYGGLGGSTTSLVLNIGSQVSQLTASSDSATTALSKIQETYSVLGNVSSLASSVLSDLSSDISGSDANSTDISNIASDASTWISELGSLLNTQYAGSYLFSGTATDTKPVDTTDYAPTSADTADTSYYQGSSTGTTFYGSNGFSVSTSVQADNSGFEQILRGISLVEQAASSDSSSLSTTLSQAYSLIQAGSTQLSDTQATLSANSSALTQYQTDTSTQINTLTTLSSDLDGADISTAVVQASDLSDQLNASYETVTKLISDSLASYLS